ncbi:MAG TPA: hypothetical protein VHO02_06835 [Fibrobacteria bacterium]|nr:hypothetical protein [Fibrobacteria bacterium]
MKPMIRLAGILILAAIAVAPASAAPQMQGGDVMQSRVKAALNEMVQDVKAAPAPAEKRRILEKFLGKIETRSKWAQSLPFVDDENREMLAQLHDRFATHRAELMGTSGGAPVTDAALDAYASFLQQDMEQAEASWGNGGIYLSTGAVIIVLLIIILVT